YPLEWWVAGHLFLLLQIGIVASLLGAVGLFTRPALILCGVCFLLTQNFWFRMSLFHDDWLYFNAYLWILAFSPSSDAWSVDAWLRRRRGLDAPAPSRRHTLAIELMVLWFAGIYVAAGLAKIFPLVKVWDWVSGYRAQRFAQEFLLDSPIYWL